MRAIHPFLLAAVLLKRVFITQNLLGATLSMILLPYGAYAAAPVVSNVHGSQDAATGKVQVFYNLADSDTPKLQVTLQVSADAGATWGVAAHTFDKTSGIGDDVTPGAGKLIVWNAKADWPGNVSNQVRFKVNATDTPVPPAPAGMALIPAGSFQRGDVFSEGDTDELPVRAVYVSAFYIDKFEVTEALWTDIVTWAGSHGYDLTNPITRKGSNYPISQDDWYACVKWCNARSEKAGLIPCYTVNGATYKTGISEPDCNFAASGYRLPTEAEWEKAARGGSSGKRFPWGDTISHSLANYNSYEGNTYDVSPTRGLHPIFNDGQSWWFVSPVGFFSPNGYGVYDIAGNVWEWCWDWYSPNYYSSSSSLSDPTGPVSGEIPGTNQTFRVERGGSWYDSYCRVANRGIASYLVQGADYAYYVGFRCVRR